METLIRTLCAVFLAGLLCSSAIAQPRWRSPYRNNLPPGLAKRNGNLPPGLQKHVYRTGHLPPGLEKRYENSWYRDRADRVQWRGHSRIKHWKY